MVGVGVKAALAGKAAPHGGGDVVAGDVHVMEMEAIADVTV